MIKTFKLGKDNKYRQYVLRLCGVSICAMTLSNGIGWMRILGKGIHWKDTTKHRLYFSERSGFKKALNVGKWRLSLLY